MSAVASLRMLAFEAIGTRWEIETCEPLDTDVQRLISERIDRYDRIYSRFRADSLVSRMATAPAGGRFEFPDDAHELFDLYDHLIAATEGAVDPLVGQALELLGYDAAYSLTPAPATVRVQHHARGRPAWPSAVRREGTMLVTHHPVLLDVGAAGKGQLVDIVSAILSEAGVARFVVDAGGDLRHEGDDAIQVGLPHPHDHRLVIGTAQVRQRALCASGVDRRAWGDGLHHLIDARTGVPAAEVTAAWVIAEDAAVADGLATALFFSDAQRLAETFRFSHVLLRADGRAETSADFDGELFT